MSRKAVKLILFIFGAAVFLFGVHYSLVIR